jgi:Trk K+ transport system NAD-binding subunit
MWATDCPRGPCPRHEVIVVEHAQEAADRFEKLGVDMVIGSRTSAEVLARVNIGRADVFPG